MPTLPAERRRRVLGLAWTTEQIREVRPDIAEVPIATAGEATAPAPPGACPDWCCNTHVVSGDGHLSEHSEVELSLMPRIVVGFAGETTRDYLAVLAEQLPGDAPSVSLMHNDDELTQMTPSEALALAAALARSAWQADPAAVAAVAVPAPDGLACPSWCGYGGQHTSPDDIHLSPPASVTAAGLHHGCSYTEGPGGQLGCDEPVSAGLVYEPGTGPVTVELYHGDEILPRLTPAGAVTLALGILADVLGAAAVDGRNA